MVKLWEAVSMTSFAHFIAVAFAEGLDMIPLGLDHDAPTRYDRYSSTIRYNLSRVSCTNVSIKHYYYLS